MNARIFPSDGPHCVLLGLLFVVSLMIAGCGGGGSGGAGSPTYTIGGLITSLSGSGLVVQLNGTTNVTIGAGATSYSFPPVPNGTVYSIAIQNQPASPSQTCTVMNATGTVSGANITNANINCSTNSYLVGGTVSGLVGSGLVLQLNGSALLPISSSRSFTFATSPVLSNQPYNVSVLSQPTSPAQTCTVVNGSGVMQNANVTNIQVNCITNISSVPHTVGGSVSGLSGNGLILQLNGVSNLPLSAGATTFTFATTVAMNANYTVNVYAQPSGQTCTVVNGSGTVSTTDITDIQVYCSNNTYSVGGTISGLSGSGLVLQLNGSDNLRVTGNGSFAFPSVANNSPYAVAVLTQPFSPSQTCTVTNQNGTVSGANIANVQVSCVTDVFTISGVVSGLSGTGLVLRNNGGDDLPIGNNGSFTFSIPVPSGATYNIQVYAQPASPAQSCTIAFPTGTVGNVNITSVQVYCANNTYSVGGTVSGLTGSGLVLQLNGDNNQNINTNGIFAFGSPVASGSHYTVSVLTHPVLQTCVIVNATGVVDAADIGNVQVNCGAASWNGTKQFGTPTDDVANGIATDINGNLYVAGCYGGAVVNNDVSYKNTCDTTGATALVYVRKYNPLGEVQWEQSLIPIGNSEANGVAVDVNGNVYVTGFVYGSFDNQTAIGGKDIFLTKFNSTGSRLWTVQYGSVSDDQGNAIAVDNSGNVYVVGTTFGSFDGQVNKGLKDAFVTKFDSSGNRLWTLIHGTAADDFGLGVAIDGSDNPYVAGTTLGSFGDPNQGAEDIFASGLDSTSGTVLWTVQLGTASPDFSAGVAADSSGAVYIAGYTGGSLPGFTNPTPGGRDLFIARIDTSSCSTSCSFSWIQQLLSAGNEYATGVAVSSSGVFITGYTYGSLDGNSNADSSGQTSDIFVTRYSSSGAMQWTRMIGTTTNDKAYAATTDAADNVYAAGFSLGDLDANSSSGGADFVILKYLANGDKQ